APASPAAESGSTPEESADTPAAARPSFGSFTAPGIEEKDYTQEIFANADLTMVNIWGTFCGPCIEEMPYLGELAEEYRDKGFQIVGIVADAASRLGGYDKSVVSTAWEIIEQTGADYIHLLPSEDLMNIKLNQVQYIPETVFVDKNGGIVGEPIVGGKSKEEWKEIIDAYLALVQ
ncbi:MAG TPA: TlpA disulfide reductase family protein, partial [Feifaniaceae bacterium]|nr:TlpA disulfide reductase family protein [Feifaniaceae bacterium]